MAAKSAGLLLYRTTDHGEVEVLIAHPGGPFWAGKDEGAWSVPKGEYGPGADRLAAAYREFREETGFDAAERGRHQPRGAAPARREAGDHLGARG